MLAIELRNKIDKIIKKHGEDIEIIYAGSEELIICEDTGSEFIGVDILNIDKLK